MEDDGPDISSPLSSPLSSPTPGSRRSNLPPGPVAGYSNIGLYPRQPAVPFTPPRQSGGGSRSPRSRAATVEDCESDDEDNREDHATPRRTFQDPSSRIEHSPLSSLPSSSPPENRAGSPRARPPQASVPHADRIQQSLEPNQQWPSDTSFVPSSPVRGATAKERAAHRREKEIRHLWQERRQSEQDEQQREEARKRAVYDNILERLKAEGCSWGDLALYVSDPSNWKGDFRHQGFFSVPGRVETILNNWTSGNNRGTQGRGAIMRWALDFVAREVEREGKAASEDGFLRTENKTIDENFSRDFSLLAMREKLLELCPKFMHLLETFSTTSRQAAELTDENKQRKHMAITSAILACLGTRSQRNNYFKAIISLYAYAEGAHRQVISVLSHLGITVSYSTLVSGKKSTEENTAPEEICSKDNTSKDDGSRVVDAANSINSHEGDGSTRDDNDNEPESSRSMKGFLKRLSDACRSAARTEALTDLLAFVYDNINMSFKAAEQILGRKDSQENGTCATAFRLFNASVDDMQTKDSIAQYLSAPELERQDILLSTEEDRQFTDRLKHTILRIIVLYGGDRFAKFKDEVLASTPFTEDKIPLHKTATFPLPAMAIDESSTVGNAEVVSAMFKEVGKNMDSPEFPRIVRILAGDQLSLARLRSIIFNRLGHDSFAHSYVWALFMPGLFHYKMAFMHGFMETHYGNTNSSSNPGSLAFHNTVLDRKPIVLSSLPPFRTSRDLVFVSLYARVLHCLIRVSGYDSLDSLATNPAVTYDRLVSYASQIYDEFADPSIAYRLRREREREQLQRATVGGVNDPTVPQVQPTKGDMVFENAVLYMRDALVIREFTDAVKSGDSGRVVTALKVMALMYRGMGRTKYAHEMLHLVHNLTHVWPAPLRRIVLQNWLVNPTGKADSWVEVDLMQEHFNFWIKAIYRAHGSAASWEWLAMISPCINILRQIARQIHADLGSQQGTKHTSPNLDRDIQLLMESLHEHGVYAVEHGRTIVVDEAVEAVPNVFSMGLKSLKESLTDYNDMFRLLRKRFSMLPLVGGRYADAAAGRVAGESGNPTEPHPVNDAAVTPEEDITEQDDSVSVSSDDSMAISEADDTEYERWFSLDTPGDVALDMDIPEDSEDF